MGLIGQRQIVQLPDIAATVSAQVVENLACPHGTRATPECGAMRQTSQLSLFGVGSVSVTLYVHPYYVD